MKIQKWEYYINLDERGDFSADVRDEKGETKFEIEGFEIFEDGFMRSKTDVSGLESYLKDLGIMPKNASLSRANPLTKKEYKNVMAEARIHARIKKPFYRGQAEGMKDIAKQYKINPVVPFDKALEKAFAEHNKKFGPVARRFADIRLIPKDYMFKGSPETYVITSAKGTTYHQRRYCLNPSTRPWEKCGLCLAMVPSPVFSPGPEHLKGCPRHKEPEKRRVKTITAKSNPGTTKIYNRCLQIYASKEGMSHNCDSACKKAGHRYQHKFSKKACIYGLSDGSLLIK